MKYGVGGNDRTKNDSLPPPVVLMSDSSYYHSRDINAGLIPACHSRYGLSWHVTRVLCIMADKSLSLVTNNNPAGGKGEDTDHW